MLDAFHNPVIYGVGVLDEVGVSMTYRFGLRDCSDALQIQSIVSWKLINASWKLGRTVSNLEV